jgi:ABC-2 type transport system permease protein/lipopolysaccharide transport system permease protein
MSAVAPPPEILFKRRIRFGPALREAWDRRELVVTLVERDLRVRYKQTILGFAWSLIVPICLMVVFQVFVNRVGHVETFDVPYHLWVFVGLIPWSFFSLSVNQGGQTIVNSVGLLSKVYCPRELFPISTIAVAAFDALISTSVLCLLFIGAGFAPKAATIWLPVPLLIQFAFTTGVTLILAALVVYIRDLRQALPLLLQLGLFATPVAYPVALSPAFDRVYAVLNPLAPVINTYRETILYGNNPDFELLGLAALSSIVVLISGYWIFKRLETNFADVA